MRLLSFTIVLVVQLSSSLCVSATRLMAREKAREPINVQPSQNWDGLDGPWSSFTLQVGSPAQNTRVFVSTASSNTWVVRSDACLMRDVDCLEARGRLFNLEASSTWQNIGNYQLDVDKSLGLSVLGTFGNDTLGLGIQGSGGPILRNQIIGAYSNDELYMGTLGLNPSNTSFGATTKGGPSLMTALKEQGLIESLSFGYTAGNQYRLKQAFGSLTLGGYDSAQLPPNQLSIAFANNDPSSALQVSIQRISFTEQGEKETALLSTPIPAHVDSTESMIRLPMAACQAFEKAFNLTWDEKNELYLVDDDLHTALQLQNTSVTFSVGNQTSGGPTTDIVFPYKSFDLMLKPPYPGFKQNQRYFPLKRSVNDSQNTLGRTFLQEVYLIVDWERRNFSLSQLNFTTAPPNLVTIYPPDSPPPSNSSLSTGAKVGIAIAVVVVLALLVSVLVYLCLRRRKARLEATKSGANPAEATIKQGFAKGEMGTGIENARFEMEGSDGNALRPYGGRTPPWVTEKMQASQTGDVDSRNGRHVAELSPASRALRGLPRSFFGGRGVHEMYDPSSVRPSELQGDNGWSGRVEMEGSTPGASVRQSPPTPRSPFSRPLSSRPSPPTPAGLGSRFFGLWRRSGGDSSGPSSPDAPSAPFAPSSMASGTPNMRSKDGEGFVSPAATHEFSSPVSRQGMFSERHRAGRGGVGRENIMLSPVSSASDDDERSFWGLGRS